MPSGLFNVQNIALWGQENYFKTLAKYVPEYVPATPGMPLAQQAARLYDSLTTAPSNEVLGPLPSSERHQVYRFPRVDDWLLEDWTRQHSIDPRVYPSKRRLAELTLFHPVPRSREGLALLLALCRIPERPVVIMLAPFFRHGGGERMVIAYLNAFRRECPDRSVVLLRLRDENVSYDGLDENVIVVELSRIFARLAISPGASQHALLRILIERAPDVFWTVNNDFGLDALGEFGNAIGTNSLRATSIFGPGLTVDGYAGYAVTRIPSLADKLDLLVADNEAILRTLRTVFAIDAEKMLFCPAPAASWVTSPQKEESPKENPQRQAPMRVLWFSRLDFEKRVDLLLATASLFAASEAVFVVYGAAVVGDTSTDYVKALKEHPSIEYRGEFEAIDVLAKDHFDAYLYTSASDGFPFVLLEAAAMDLPIVASDVGGVGEVIGDKTGYLVSAKDDPQAYAEALRKIRNNPGEAAERARELRRWIATERSQARFDAAVRSILARAQTAISGDA